MRDSHSLFFRPALLRPRRVARMARNAAAYYVLSKPLRRTINPRREALRRQYAPKPHERVVDWLLRDLRKS
jgi:hypothetical protein